MERVPVFCEAYGGFGALQGVLQFDGENLVLCYQTADALFGVVRSDAKRLVFPLAGVGHIKYRAGWFWLMPVIEVAPSDFEALSQLPVSHEGQLRMRVKFAHRRKAARLVESLAMAAVDQRLRRLDDELARMGRHPADPATPGSESPPLARPSPRSDELE